MVSRSRIYTGRAMIASRTPPQPVALVSSMSMIVDLKSHYEKKLHNYHT